MKLLLIILALLSVACSGHQSDTVAIARNDVKQSNEAKNQNENVPTPSPAITPTPELNVAFGKGLRIVPKDIKLENQRLRYKIDVTYPQIEGTKNPEILNLNHRMRLLVSEQYRWPLNPSKEDLLYYQKHPDIFNTIDSTYEVPLATDDLLSIYIEGYSYGIGAAHSVQYSFTVNYDLSSGKLLKLADIFKPTVNHLQFISQYCLNELTKRHGGESIWKEALTPKEKNYESWNITNEGITINFDACKVDGCAGGEQEVKIPFATLKDMLNPNSPVILLAK
ncbi:MAG TPA: DUF3298 domain-containing protein [Pyrinomonadaceae bacterium]